MFDVILLLIVAAVTWCVASEGAWGAGFMLLHVIIAGLLAMNFFEPLAGLIESVMSVTTVTGSLRADFVSLVGLFALFVFLQRLLSEQLARTFMSVHQAAYSPLRWVLGLMTGYITMAFLLTALHCAPLPRTYLNYTPERKNLFDVVAPDRQWLGFTQYTSERILGRGPIFDGPVITYGSKPPYPNEIWPSFPIRYAHRRAMQEVSVDQVPTQAPGTSTPAPSTGGGSGGAPAF